KLRSVTTTSGRCDRTTTIASMPLSVDPTTSIPGTASSKVRKPSPITGSSSQMSTRIVIVSTSLRTGVKVVSPSSCGSGEGPTGAGGAGGSGPVQPLPLLPPLTEPAGLGAVTAAGRC